MLGPLVGLVVGQFRSRASLVAENELLRQQLAAAKSRLPSWREQSCGRRLSDRVLAKDRRHSCHLHSRCDAPFWFSNVAHLRLALTSRALLRPTVAPLGTSRLNRSP